MSNDYMMYSEFPLAEYDARLEKARELMGEHNVDALLLCEREDIEYFSGFWSQEWGTKEQTFAALFPKEGDPILFVPSFMRGTAHMTSWVKDIKGYAAHNHHTERFVPVVAKAIKDLGLDGKVIGIESGVGFLLRMPLIYYEAIKSELPETTFTDAADIIQRTRIVKSELEIERIKQACMITCKAYRRTFDSLKEGMSEKEIHRIHNIAMLEEGADSASFINLRAGTRPMPGSNPTDRKLRKGDIFFCDSGALYRGYHCDMIRIAHIGRPCPEEDKKLYDTIVRAQRAGINMMKPGTRAGDVHAAVMEVLNTSAYKFQVLYMIGHGVGLEVHEKPWIRVADETRLEPGMVLSLEPWMYNPARGVFCVEDNILVTKEGNEILTPIEKEELFTVPC